MCRKLFLRTVAGLFGSFVLVCATAHAQQRETGGNQTGGGTSGGAQTGGSTGTTGLTGGTFTGSTNTGSSGGGSTGQPFGATFDPSRFGQPGTGAGYSGSPAGRGTRGTIGGRTNRSTLGRGGLGRGNFNAFGGVGRGGLSGQQMNRQADQRAQYATRIDFASPAPAEPLAPTLELRTTIEQSLAAVAPSGITATLDGSAVILKGTVASEFDRKLAERMVLLEPGVRSVQNELLVQGRSSSEQ